MGRRRTTQQLIDEATRLVLAYNHASRFDGDTPMVWFEIGGREPARITIMMPDGADYCRYGGKKPDVGKTLKDGIAKVKQLLHEYRETERNGTEQETD